MSARVLVADGEASIRQRLFSRLLDADVYSDCVANGVDALRKLDESLYGVVVLDIALPGVDIVQILRRIAAIPDSARPVVLVLAANPEAARTLEVEVIQIVLRKPVDLRQLTELVRSCLRTLTARRGDVPPGPAPADQPTTT